MNEDEEQLDTQPRSKAPWIVAGILGGAALVGAIAFATMKKKPRAFDWHGYQIEVEDREVEEAAKPFRWTVSSGETLLTQGLATTYEEAVDSAKTAAGGLAELAAAGKAIRGVVDGAADKVQGVAA